MIETERTIFTVLSEDDVADILVMYTDKDTFKYIGPLANLTQEKYIERLQAKIKEVTDKTGYHWVCREKETKELIGVLNLNPMPGYNRLHMGYQVRQHLWGQGYGKEMSVKLVDIAFREKKLKEIYAMIESEHMVSRKILLGLGFSLFETKDEKGVTLEIYKLINPLM